MSMNYMRQGSMLMEAVLTVPIVVTLCLACIQFCMVAYAWLMTEHAAAVAVRVAEVQQPQYRVQEATWAARRILVPVSWSYSSVDVAGYKSNAWDKVGGAVGKAPDKIKPYLDPAVDKFNELLDKIPDNLDATMADYPPAARQPFGWYPLWNAGWIEDQVDVTIEHKTSTDGIKYLFCTVEFLCPLHVPVVAPILRKVLGDDAVTDLEPKIIYGYVSSGYNIPCLKLSARAMRVLPIDIAGNVGNRLMPRVESEKRLGQ